MKLFTTFRFVFAMFLATSFLISAFILLYSYISDNEIKGNLLENKSVNSVSSAESIGKANSNQRLADIPADSNVEQFLQKSKMTLSISNQK